MKNSVIVNGIDRMIRLFTYFSILLFCHFSTAQEGEFKISQIGSNNLFSGAWEVTWGPDEYLWVSERVGKNIYRINHEDGNKDLLYHFNNAIQDEPQNGLLGFALHSELGQSTGNDYLYASYTYLDGQVKKQKIVRFTYSVDDNDGILSNEMDILIGLPSSNDHNSGRLVYGPDAKLYYSIGDQGSNRGGNACKPILAQIIPTRAEIDIEDFSHYPGKTLRINLDGSIPEDNPVIEGIRSHIYTYGHRNPQGLVFSGDGILYSDEHGDNTDDEINLLQSGKNYGWPHVVGYQDDKVYRYCNYSSIQDCTSSMWDNYDCNDLATSTAETEWNHPDFQPPIATMFTVENGYDFFSAACPNNWICRPNVAPSSLDIYGSYENGIPGWENSLLVISLKRGRIYRYQLAEDGLSVNQDYTEHWNTINRYRDIAIHPNGRDFFVITDNSGGTEAADGLNRTSNLENPGALLKYSFVLDSELDADNTLSSLSVAEGKLVPEFEPNLTDYSIAVPEGTTSLNISAQATSSTATVQIGAFTTIPRSDKVIVTAENGSKREYTIHVTIQAKILSTYDAKDLGISIGPNPVNHRLQIKSDLFSGMEQLSIFDLSGKMMRLPITRLGSGNYEVEMKSLKNGVYILKLEADKSNYSFRVFKK
jgi:PQQ-dependent dehydrogenase (s-GDH family)